MELLDLDDFDVEILHHAAATLDAEARFERELALRLSLREKHEWANRIRGLCSEAWRSRHRAERRSA
jgi:hypothetical protein